jgi:hypothetical protein
MKTIIAIVVLFTLCSYSHAGTLAPTHPIIGTWQVQVPGTTCSELYSFKANGTTSVKSAEEAGENVFEISATPDSNGYYKLTDTVTKSNGKLDCTGESTPVGDTVTVYIHFENSPDKFLFCMNETPDKCVGPFERIVKGSSP